MDLSLLNWRIAVTEGRQLQELCGLLEKEGATVISCPMIEIADSPESDKINSWLNNLFNQQFSWVLFSTGEGITRLTQFSNRNSQHDLWVNALKKTKIMVRGPKPVQALKSLQIQPTKIVSPPTSEGLIEALKAVQTDEILAEQSIGLQWYKPEESIVEQYLQSIGCKVNTIVPYIYQQKSDNQAIISLIEQLSEGLIHILVLTSSPQLDFLYKVARENHLVDKLEVGLQRTLIASVGPMVTQKLSEYGLIPTIAPDQGFVMKNLVQQIKKYIQSLKK